MVLNGANTYGGGTTIDSGVLQANGAGVWHGGNITFAGGTLQYTAASAAGLDYSGRFVDSTSPIAIDTNGQTVTFADAIAASNSGGLTKIGTGTLILASVESTPGRTIT